MPKASQPGRSRSRASPPPTAGVVELVQTPWSPRLGRSERGPGHLACLFPPIVERCRHVPAVAQDVDETHVGQRLADLVDEVEMGRSLLQPHVGAPCGTVTLGLSTAGLTLVTIIPADGSGNAQEFP